MNYLADTERARRVELLINVQTRDSRLALIKTELQLCRVRKEQVEVTKRAAPSRFTLSVARLMRARRETYRERDTKLGLKFAQS